MVDSKWNDGLNIFCFGRGLFENLVKVLHFRLVLYARRGEGEAFGFSRQLSKETIK